MAHSSRCSHPSDLDTTLCFLILSTRFPVRWETLFSGGLYFAENDPLSLADLSVHLKCFYHLCLAIL